MEIMNPAMFGGLQEPNKATIKEIQNGRRFQIELKMNQYQLPEKVSFNYEELKTGLQAKVSQYETLIYSDEQIKDAKADKAQLNKLKKALNDERIRLQKEYMIPFNDFKAKIDELINIIDKPVGLIDKQIHDFEEQKKQDKLAAIKGYWEACEKPFDIALEKVLDQKWLNASISLKSVYGAIDVLLEQITKDLSTLENLPEFSFEAKEVYKTTLDLGLAIQEGRRLSEIQKQKQEYEAEQARLKAEAAQHMISPVDEQLPGQMGFSDVESYESYVCEIKEEAHQWLGFKAYLTVTDAQALGNFMRCRGIQFEQIEIQ